MRPLRTDTNQLPSRLQGLHTTEREYAGPVNCIRLVSRALLLRPNASATRGTDYRPYSVRPSTFAATMMAIATRVMMSTFAQVLCHHRKGLVKAKTPVSIRVLTASEISSSDMGPS